MSAYSTSQTSNNQVNTLTIEIPDEMYCPITGEIMNQPMISPRGHSYEKEAILRHLVEYAERSPMTNEPLQPHRLRENRGLKSAINTIIPFITESQKFKQECKVAQFTKEQSKISIDILNKIKLESHYTNDKLYTKIIVPSSNTRDPVDVVLCIDISGSMNNEATKLDSDGTRISHGLSLLDITRGGAISVIKCLEQYDRVSIVTYSNSAKLVEDWTNLDSDGKLKLIERLKSLRTEGSTNLSDGITKSLNQFKNTGSSLNRKKAAFVFTDGIPNIIPPKGHEYMIEQWKENNPNINFLLNTLGFGFDLNDKLLKNISKIGGGEYDFIPDSAMVGDIMTHIISNVIVTLLQSAKLCIQLSNGATFTDSNIMGESYVHTTSWGKIIDINSLQYGVTRTKIVNITIPDKFKDDPSKCIETFLSFKDFKGTDKIIQSSFTFGNSIDTSYKINEIRYKLVDTINKCINILDNTDCVASNREILNVNDYIRADCGWDRYYKGTITKRHSDNTYDIKFDDGDYKYRIPITKIKPCNTTNVEPIINDLLEYINIQPVMVKENSYIKDLIKDIKGQVTEALNLSSKMKEGNDWYNRWGRKYLLSFIGAHNDERCNSSKDISLQHFTSQLFKDNFTRAENIYKTLPAPKPTITNRRPPQNSVRRAAPRSYASYDCSGPCFTGSSRVKMIDNSFKRVDRLVKGDKIFIGMAKMEPIDFATIKLVVKTKIKNGRTNIVNINDQLGITPTHPIKIDNRWVHPKNIQKPQLQNCDYVYNFVLDKDHYMIIGKTKCCTLGHNFKGPVIEHDYYGTHRVLNELKDCNGFQDGLVELQESDIIRDTNTGWVSGIDIRAQNLRLNQD